jgi:hypothetical protein
VLIVPIAHVGALATAPPALAAEVARFKSALARMYRDARGGAGLVAFERVLHARRGETPQHTHLQVVSVPAPLLPTAREALVTEGAFRAVPLTVLPPPQADAAEGGGSVGGPAGAVDAFVAAVRAGGGVQLASDVEGGTGTAEYFYMECPAPTPEGDGAAGATDGAGEGGDARPPFDRLLHVVPPGAKHPVQFGREALCRLLSLPDRLSWKSCALGLEAETAATEAFRAAFAPYDFTAEL